MTALKATQALLFCNPLNGCCSGLIGTTVGAEGERDAFVTFHARPPHELVPCPFAAVRRRLIATRLGRWRRHHATDAFSSFRDWCGHSASCNIMGGAVARAFATRLVIIASRRIWRSKPVRDVFCSRSSTRQLSPLNGHVASFRFPTTRCCSQGFRSDRRAQLCLVSIVFL